MEREEDLAVAKEVEVFLIGEVFINQFGAVTGVNKFEKFRWRHISQIGALDDQSVLGIVRLNASPKFQDTLRIFST